MSSKSDNTDKKASYQFIKKILIEVQELNENEQITYIKKSCEQRPELLSSLMNMLNLGHSEYAKSMESPPILEHIPKIDTQSSIEEPSLPAGTKISQYEIIEKIGSGGMGNVYAAQQNFPAERKVALKLLKSTPNQQLLITETQILARLNHPNIATLFEIAKTEEGQFFIAMELIKGEDIISWCKNYNYSNVQIINLFQQLCLGISCAHELNIIHCDIKPSNVLVTDIDDNATVKIIDFGISQLDDEKEPYQDISGTPAYMAPEVLSSKNALLPDVRRDVFALGILLKKLLPQTLPIDLLAIIDKASAHNKNNRYKSSAALNKDLNRYLKKQTVSARESNVWYATKLLFQRRFEVFMLVALILILSLLSAYFAQVKQAEIAIGQTKAAKIAQHEAEELTNFLTGLFEAANPDRTNSDVLTAVDLLDKAKKKLLTIETPNLSDARFMHTIAIIYIRMDKIQDAKELIEQSLIIKKALFDEQHSELVDGYIQLGLINKKLGENEKAEKLLLAVLKSLLQQNNPDEVQLAYIHNHLGNLYIKRKQFDKSIKQHRQAIKLRKKQTDNRLLADSYNNLGVIYNNTKQWENASKYFNLSLAILLTKHHENHPFIGAVKNNLAYIEEQRYNWKISEKLLKEALLSWQKSYGQEHLKTIIAQRSLMYFYNRRMQYQQAISIGTQLVEHFRSQNNTKKLVKYMSLLAFSYAHDHQFIKANNYHQQALNLLKEKKSKSIYTYARAHNRFAESLMQQNDFDGAKILILKSLKRLEKNTKKNDANVMETLNLLSDLYYQQGDLNSSLELYDRVIIQNILKKTRNQKIQIKAYLGLGRIYLKKGMFQKSTESFNHALTIANRIDDIYINNAIIYYEMAQLHIKQSDFDKAKQMLNQALEIQKITLPAQHKDLLATEKMLETL